MRNLIMQLFATAASVLITAPVLSTLAVLWAKPTQADGILYFADLFTGGFDQGSIKRIRTDGTGVHTLVCTGGGVRGFAIDVAGGKMYWSNVDDDVIRRANLDGSSPEELVSDVPFPFSIDLHTKNGHMYWTDQGTGQLSRANLDGSNVEILLTQDFGGMRGTVIDPVNEMVYWANVPSIFRANLDGSNPEAIVTFGFPAKIALDPAGGKMYWTDHCPNAVWRANLDGSEIEQLFFEGGNGNSDGIALDLADGKVYWGEDVSPGGYEIMRMNLDGSDPEFVAGSFGIVSEMVFVPEAPLLCLGDLNGDEIIGVADLLALLSAWGKCPAKETCTADINGDGDVNKADLCVLLSNWGPCP